MESTYSEGIAKKILFDPIDNGANRLCILSSHATPSMASWLMTTYEEQGIENVSIKVFRLLSEAKQRTTRYAGAHQKLYTCYIKSRPYMIQ